MTLHPLSVSQSIAGRIIEPNPTPKVTVTEAIDFLDKLIYYVSLRVMFNKEKEACKLDHDKNELEKHQKASSKQESTCLPKSWSKSFRELHAAEILAEQASIKHNNALFKFEVALPDKFREDKIVAEMFRKLKMDFYPNLSNFHELIIKLMESTITTLDLPVLEKTITRRFTQEWDEEVIYQTPTHVLMKVKVENTKSHEVCEAIMLTTQKCIEIFPIHFPLPFEILIANWKISEMPLTVRAPCYGTSLWCMCTKVDTRHIRTYKKTLQKIKNIVDFASVNQTYEIETRVEVLRRFLSKDTIGVVITYLGQDEIEPGNLPS